MPDGERVPCTVFAKHGNIGHDAASAIEREDGGLMTNADLGNGTVGRPGALRIRRAAFDARVPPITDLQLAWVVIEAC